MVDVASVIIGFKNIAVGEEPDFHFARSELHKPEHSSHFTTETLLSCLRGAIDIIYETRVHGEEKQIAGRT